MVAVSRTEGDVTRAFVGLAGGLARGVDVLDLLDQLTGESARLLDVASAGLLSSPSSPATRCVSLTSAVRPRGGRVSVMAQRQPG